MNSKFTITVFFLLSCLFSIGQESFQKGYFKDENGIKNEVFIKNLNWDNNPISIEYKRDLSEEAISLSLPEFTEFGIYDQVKFVKKVVDIDRSSEKVNDLSISKNAEFEKDTIVLKVLVEGTATLYSYRDNSLKRYFYNVEGGDIEQLVYKMYKTPSNKIATNSRYKQQLFNNLNCEIFTASKLNSIEYKVKPLIGFFKKYNECKDSEFKVYKTKTKKGIQLTIRPGIYQSSLSIDNSNSIFSTVDYGDYTGFRLGLELEKNIGTQKRFSLILELTYQNYNKEESINTSEVSGGVLFTEIKYSSLEIPVGLRYYMNFGEKSRLFLNAGPVVDVGLGSSYDVRRANSASFPLRHGFANTINAMGGVGFLYNNKLSVELRYQTERNIFDSRPLSSEYKSLSFIIGYRLFNL